MLCALTRPAPEDLTDFGEIVPVIVFTSDIFVSLDKTSPRAGIDIVQSEAITTRAM
jgi:hypothetical protein